MNKSTILFIFKIVSVLILSGFSVDLKGQEEMKVAAGLEVFSSGNTHGAFYRPYFGIESGRNLFTFGPLCQQQSAEFRGGKLGYSRSLSNQIHRYGSDGQSMDLLQLNFTAYAQYTDNLPLSGFVAREQACVSKSKDTDWSQVRLSTAEAGAGIELRLNISRALTWRNSICLAVHHHNRFFSGLTRDRTGTSVMLCTGLLLVLD